MGLIYLVNNEQYTCNYNIQMLEDITYIISILTFWSGLLEWSPSCLKDKWKHRSTERKTHRETQRDTERHREKNGKIDRNTEREKERLIY